MPTKQPRPSFALGQKSYDSAIALAKRDGKNLSEWLRDLVEAEIQRQNMPFEPLEPTGTGLQEYNAQRRADAEIRRLLNAHRIEIESWLQQDISGHMELLNEVARGEHERYNYVYDDVSLSYDKIMNLLHSNAWNGDSVDEDFWKSDLGQVMGKVRDWLNGE